MRMKPWTSFLVIKGVCSILVQLCCIAQSCQTIMAIILYRSFTNGGLHCLHQYGELLMIVSKSISYLATIPTCIVSFSCKPCSIENIEVVVHQYIIKSCTVILITYAVVLQVCATNLCCYLGHIVQLHS